MARPYHTQREIERLYAETLYRVLVERCGPCPTCAVARTPYEHAHPAPEED